MLIVGNHPLLPDAEAAEDMREDFIIADMAGYFSQVVHTFANILRDKIAGKAGLKTGLYPVNRLKRLV
jgi:hypothetical protein